MPRPRVDSTAGSLARANDVELSSLEGTGPDGQITTADVLGLLAGRGQDAGPAGLPALPLSRGPRSMTIFYGVLASLCMVISLCVALLGLAGTSTAMDPSLLFGVALPMLLAAFCGFQAWSLFSSRVTLTDAGIASRGWGRERYVPWTDLVSPPTTLPLWFVVLQPYGTFSAGPDVVLHIRSGGENSTPRIERWLVPVSWCRDAPAVRSGIVAMAREHGAGVILFN